MGRCLQKADKAAFRFIGAILRQIQASFTFLQNASRNERSSSLKLIWSRAVSPRTE
jgi:hypothetical protein